MYRTTRNIYYIFQRDKYLFLVGKGMHDLSVRKYLNMHCRQLMQVQLALELASRIIAASTNVSRSTISLDSFVNSDSLQNARGM